MKNIQKILTVAMAALAFALLAVLIVPTPDAHAGGTTINMRSTNLLNGTTLFVPMNTTNAISQNASNVIVFASAPTNNETITISAPGKQAITYTFEPAYTNFAGMVLSDTSAANAAANLANAINLGANSGSKYGAVTPANPFVTASVINSTNVYVTAINPGPGGNSISVLLNSTNIYPLVSVQCYGGFLAQADILPVNGCGVSISYNCPTNANAITTNYVTMAFGIRGEKPPTTGPGVISVPLVFGANGLAGNKEQTLFTNVPASICGNSRQVTITYGGSAGTNSLTLTGVSVDTSPQF